MDAVSGGADTILISSPKSLIEQPYLFHEPLRGMGHARWVVGDEIERLTARLTGAVRHRTDCRADYCPDLSVGCTFIECKAVGRGGQMFVYEGRLDKDREFAARHRLIYVIWHHGAAVKGHETVESLRAAVANSIKACYVVPFSAVDVAALSVREEPLNSQYGKRPGTEKTYGSGRRMQLSAFDRWKIWRP